LYLQSSEDNDNFPFLAVAPETILSSASGFFVRQTARGRSKRVVYNEGACYGKVDF